MEWTRRQKEVQLRSFMSLLEMRGEFMTIPLFLKLKAQGALFWLHLALVGRLYAIEGAISSIKGDFS